MRQFSSAMNVNLSPRRVRLLALPNYHRHSSPLGSVAFPPFCSQEPASAVVYKIPKSSLITLPFARSIVKLICSYRNKATAIACPVLLVRSYLCPNVFFVWSFVLRSLLPISFECQFQHTISPFAPPLQVISLPLSTVHLYNPSIIFSIRYGVVLGHKTAVLAPRQPRDRSRFGNRKWNESIALGTIIADAVYFYMFARNVFGACIFFVRLNISAGQRECLR